MGISIDVEPEHWGWMLLEVICSVFFVVEIIVKLVQVGPTEFWLGESRNWNVLDLCITAMSVFEVTLSIIIKLMPDSDSAHNMATAARTAVTLRIMRAARVIRLVKLLRFKMMRELASMIVGIVIGIPALFWVFILFIMVVFVFG